MMRLFIFCAVAALAAACVVPSCVSAQLSIGQTATMARYFPTTDTIWGSCQVQVPASCNPEGFFAMSVTPTTFKVQALIRAGFSDGDVKNGRFSSANANAIKHAAAHQPAMQALQRSQRRKEDSARDATPLRTAAAPICLSTGTGSSKCTSSAEYKDADSTWQHRRASIQACLTS